MGTAATIASFLLGASGLLAAIFAVYTQARDRTRSIRRQEIDISKLEKTIELDETTRERITAEAAQINSDWKIATERWWKEQFDAVKNELVDEQKLRRRLTKWADQHQQWDERAWRLAKQTDPSYPPPPVLEHDS